MRQKPGNVLLLSITRNLVLLERVDRFHRLHVVVLPEQPLDVTEWGQRKFKPGKLKAVSAIPGADDALVPFEDLSEANQHFITDLPRLRQAYGDDAVCGMTLDPSAVHALPATAGTPPRERPAPPLQPTAAPRTWRAIKDPEDERLSGNAMAVYQALPGTVAHIVETMDQDLFSSTQPLKQAVGWYLNDLRKKGLIICES